MKNLLIASDRFLPEKNGLVRFLEEIIPLIEHKYNISLLVPNRGDEGLKLGTGNFNTIKIPAYRFQVGDYSPAKPKLGLIKKVQYNKVLEKIKSIYKNYCL